MIKILLLVVLLFSNVIAFSQKFSFIPYSTSEGLPQSQVSSIVQDNQGYLWIGTLGGLAKFNGGEFTTFSSENGLLNNRISFLTIIDQELWVGHEGGVSCFRNGKFVSWKISDNDKVSNTKSIVKFNGNVYVASHLGLYEIIESDVKKVVDESNYLNHIRSIVVYDSLAYIATLEGLYFTSDMREISQFEPLNDVNISGLAIEKNNLIVTSYFEGVYNINLLNLKFSKVNIGSDNYTVKGVYVDSKMNKWYNTNSGIIRQDSSKNIKIIDEQSGLSFGLISAIYEDNEGSIWIGTLGKGVLRFPSQDFVFFDVSSGILSDLILTIKSDEFGNLWFGSFDQGVFKRTQSGFKSIYSDVDNHIWSSVFGVDNSKWFGSDYGLIKVIDEKVDQIFYQENGLASDAVTSLYRLDSTSMFVGGTNGFSLYKNGLFHYIKESHSIGIVRDFELLNGELFCATSKGLFMKKGNSIKKVCELDKPVSCIEIDNENNLWVGTEEGLYIYRNKEFKRVVFSNLPSSNLINFLNQKDGEVFIGTNNGLYVIEDYNDKNVSFSYFGVGDGLVDVETNLNSDFYDNDGRLWFGTSSGLIRFDYNKNFKKKSSPVLNLKSILLNYSKKELLKFSKNRNGKPYNINLPYNKNNLAFEIDGVSLSNHSNLSYQFKLLGLDNNWSPLSKNSVISFTGLGAEDYTLFLRAVDENGVFSNVIKVPFVINSPFYKTYWFIITVLIIISSIVYFLFKLKVKRELQISNNKMLAYKSKLMSLEQKSLNASMNRHFIFNSLNSIQYFINSQDRLSANRYLTNFAKLIRKNLDATNESGNMVTLAQEIEGLDLYLSLEAMRFKGRFEYQINTNHIDLESIVIPAMLLQPFIENAIIHGVLPNENNKGKIEVTLTSETNILTIQIDDNGIGIKNSLRLKELVVGDHKSQGMEITAKRIDLIKKISNKGFEIIGPFQVGGIDSQVSGTRVLLKIPFESLVD